MHSPIAEQRRTAFQDTHLHPILQHDGYDFEEWAKNFRDLGGTLLTVNDSGGIGTKIGIKADDHLFPVDSNGITTSQVMHVVLRRITRRWTGFQGTVHLPCATEKFQPVDIASETQLVPTSAYDVPADGFMQAFAIKRSPVFGEQEFAPFLGDGYRSAADDLFLMTQEFFNDHFYAPPPVAGRRVYFCFNESVHVVLKRLVEAARQLEARSKVEQVMEHQDRVGGRQLANPETGPQTVDTCKGNCGARRSLLEDVVLVAVPFGDDIAEPGLGCEPFTAGAYKEAYEKYEQILDVEDAAEILEHRQHFVNHSTWRR